MSPLRRLVHLLRGLTHCEKCGRRLSFSSSGTFTEDGDIKDAWCDPCTDYVPVWVAKEERLRGL